MLAASCDCGALGNVADLLTARVAYPNALVRGRAAARRRAAREVEQRQIDLEDWIAAAKAREQAANS
jgi:uncharacterized protein YbjT (DUF2867 family)